MKSNDFTTECKPGKYTTLPRGTQERITNLLISHEKVFDKDIYNQKPDEILGYFLSILLELDVRKAAILVKELNLIYEDIIHSYSERSPNSGVINERNNPR